MKSPGLPMTLFTTEYHSGIRWPGRLLASPPGALMMVWSTRKLERKSIRAATFSSVGMGGNRERPVLFRWHKQMLAHLGSAAPDELLRRTWVLKTPFYVGMLEDLAEAYPDAHIVMTHRRPLKSLASLTALQMKLRRCRTSCISPGRPWSRLISPDFPCAV